MKKWIAVVLAAVAVGLLINWWMRKSQLKEEVQVPVVRMLPTPTVTPKQVSKFAVMADIHEDWDDFRYLLARAKERGSKFVIIDGDMTSLGKEEKLVEAKRALEESGLTYYVVPGNHDLWTEQREKKAIFERVFGRYYTTFYDGGTKFLLLNNGDWKGLGSKQKKWLEGEVKECLQIRCLAVMHMPLNHNFSTHVMGEDNESTAKEAEELLVLLENNGVKEIISGHLHYSGSYELEGVRTYLVGAVTKPRNNQTPRYTEFVVEENDLVTEVIKRD